MNRCQVSRSHNAVASASSAPQNWRPALGGWAQAAEHSGPGSAAGPAKASAALPRMKWKTLRTGPVREARSWKRRADWHCPQTYFAFSEREVREAPSRTTPSGAREPLRLRRSASPPVLLAAPGGQGAMRRTHKHRDASGPVWVTGYPSTAGKWMPLERCRVARPPWVCPAPFSTAAAARGASPPAPDAAQARLGPGVHLGLWKTNARPVFSPPAAGP